MITLDTYSASTAAEMGSKAAQLFALQNAGISVPSLVVLTCTEVRDIAAAGMVAPMVRTQITQQVSGDQYAVRSAVLSEDGVESAQAGRFTSVLRVTPDTLESAILQVVRDAMDKLGSDESISIIIQTYIEADYGGVLFTRHPAGEYSRVVEYQQGTVEQVVHGGEVQRCVFVSATDAHISQLPFGSELIKIGEAIETLYTWPQDIEWVWQADQLYIVQARPITTLTKAQYAGLLLIDQSLVHDTDYYYTKAPAAETFQQPTPLSFSILQMLHAAGGPIQRAYAESQVRYTPQQEHVQFGSTVYVVKHKELQSLFPAYRYVSGQPRLQYFRIGDWYSTWRNSWNVHRLPIKKKVAVLQHQLQASVKKTVQLDLPLTESVAQLLLEYQTIFTAALYAKKAAQDLERFLGLDGKKYLSDFLTPTKHIDYSFIDLSLLQGNSLHIDDSSDFVYQKKNVDTDRIDLAYSWLASLPSWRRHALLPKITLAQQYMELREAGRIVSVQKISQVRASVIHQCKMVDADLLAFATLDELLSGTDSDALRKQRHAAYQQNCQLPMPAIISSEQVSVGAVKNYGVSGGVARGVVVSIHTFVAGMPNQILYVDTLSPDVVQYFTDVVGVVSCVGGLLSHAAIMAREAGVPVVITADQMITIGDSISINGNTGLISMMRD